MKRAKMQAEFHENKELNQSDFHKNKELDQSDFHKNKEGADTVFAAIRKADVLPSRPGLWYPWPRQRHGASFPWPANSESPTAIEATVVEVCGSAGYNWFDLRV